MNHRERLVKVARMLGEEELARQLAKKPGDQAAKIYKGARPVMLAAIREEASELKPEK